MRQGGQGLGSPAHGHLNPCLNGWGFRGRSPKMAPRNAGVPWRPAARHDREANARYAPTRLRSKSLPTLPLARLVEGTESVSRPIEGLDSHDAARTLRTQLGALTAPLRARVD